MKRRYKALGLLLLLILTQQGAVVHELGHLFGAIRSEVLRVDAPATVETACPLCAEFAQAITPAFSHTFEIPTLALAEPEVGTDAGHLTITAAVPVARSRGPPSSS